jgi:cation diffusion facilitator family transporter
MFSLLKNAAEATSEEARRGQMFAILLSLGVGFLMLAGKVYAYLSTGSAAILSDAAESVVHVFAVGFAAYSLWLSRRPPDESHPYGHEKIAFFSAGVEGALIVAAAAYIIYAAVSKWIAGLALQNLSTGTLLVAAAGAINGALGGFLVWKGKRTGSLVLVANGRHVLTDVWTSAGVVAGLLLTALTKWLPLDPIVAILVATNIVWSGVQLVRRSIGGLMDEGDAELESAIAKTLDEETRARGLRYHELRYRSTGTSVWVELHLLFPPAMSLREAHERATDLERAFVERLPVQVKVITHLEPAAGHDDAHRGLGVPDD